jgi:multidrug resistance efflux pump
VEIALARGRGAAAREEARAAQAAALASGDPGLAAVSAAGAASAEALERFGAARALRVRPVAPFAGVVLTADLKARAGMACAAGDTLCEVGDVDSLRAEVKVDELMLGVLDPGRPVELRAGAPPWRVARGHVLRVAPEPSGGVERRLYRVVVQVTNFRGDLRPGMSGVARLGARPAPAIEQLGGWLARILRVEFWA